ncbi:hypothetical protein D3C86_1319600 [compost metagenome]
MAIALHAVGGRSIKKFNLLPVMPELGEIVLPEHIGHHFRCQLFPDLIARLCRACIIKQIGRGDFIHRPAHFQAAHLHIIGDNFRLQADKTVRMRTGRRR